MQVLQDLPVGLQHTGFVIGDGSLPAECFDDLLYLSLVVPWHGWEQVVLDLAAERAEQEVGNAVGFEVSRGEHLPAQEVHLAVFVQDGHAFVVGGEDGSKVQPKKRLMEDDKEHSLPDGQKVEEQAQVQREVNDQEQYFGQKVLCFLLEQEIDAVDPHVKCFQQQEREE